MWQRKPVRNHNILQAKLVNQLRIASIATLKQCSRGTERPDPSSLTLAFEHGGISSEGHALKKPRCSGLRGFRRPSLPAAIEIYAGISSSSSIPKNSRRRLRQISTTIGININRLVCELPASARAGTEWNTRRSNSAPLLATEILDRRLGFRYDPAVDQQFNFRPIAKKERAGVLPSRRPATESTCADERPYSSQYGRGSQESWKIIPNPDVAAKIWPPQIFSKTPRLRHCVHSGVQPACFSWNPLRSRPQPLTIFFYLPLTSSCSKSRIRHNFESSLTQIYRRDSPVRGHPI